MSDLEGIADIPCPSDPTGQRLSENGKPNSLPITIGNSIVCDGWVSGKTTAVFNYHFFINTSFIRNSRMDGV